MKAHFEEAINKNNPAIWNRWMLDNEEKLIIFELNFFVAFQEKEISGLNFDSVIFRKKCDLRGCTFVKCSFIGSKFENDIENATFENSYFYNVLFSKSKISGVNFADSSFKNTTFSNCKICNVNFYSVSILHCIFNQGSISDCFVYGINSWKNEFNGTQQSNLSIGSYEDKKRKPGEKLITVKDIELAQFINLILENSKISKFINEVYSKVVLILGSFTPKRMIILKTIQEHLYENDFSPIIFNFAKPTNKDLTGTISLLANMAGLIIADLTDSKSILWELGVILPQVPATPVLPIILKNSNLPEMVRKDLNRYENCILGLKEYEESTIKVQLIEWIASMQTKADKIRKFRLPLLETKHFKEKKFRN